MTLVGPIPQKRLARVGGSQFVIRNARCGPNQKRGKMEGFEIKTSPQPTIIQRFSFSSVSDEWTFEKEDVAFVFELLID